MTRDIRYHACSGADFMHSSGHEGTHVDDGLVMRPDAPVPGGDWESAYWFAPPFEPGFRFDELVASWTADTPPESYITVSVLDDHKVHQFGAWSSGERPEARRSHDRADDPEIDVDIWRPKGGAERYVLFVRMWRAPGTPGPRLRSVGAVVSAGPVRTGTSSPLRRVERVLDVPRLSQMNWKELGGNGWCSPTSVSMVLAHGGTLPPTTDTGTVDIPRAAREVFDPAYDGTGNWSFNTAWAATLADHAFITRLHDLRDAERFVDVGIPLVASIAYRPGGLKGAPTHGTDGHLVVIRGFTETGDVVTNDPGAPTDRSVRRTYDRGQFERAWLDGSGGLVYVIHQSDRPLPAGSRGAW
ncbi:MAG TPA: C39 family peptidase [Nocardioides sp.]|nr:C39 family peptidase [Nocardioides sp.]